MSSPNLNPPDDVTTGPVDDAMTELRAAVEQQLGVERPQHLVIEPEACERFAADLPEELDPERRAALIERVTRAGQCVVTTADREHVPAASVPTRWVAVSDAEVREEAWAT